jgi:hypothetical protein
VAQLLEKETPHGLSLKAGCSNSPQPPKTQGKAKETPSVARGT